MKVLNCAVLTHGTHDLAFAHSAALTLSICSEPKRHVFKPPSHQCSISNVINHLGSLISQYVMRTRLWLDNEQIGSDRTPYCGNLQIKGGAHTQVTKRRMALLTQMCMNRCKWIFVSGASIMRMIVR